ncbi:hypothetical protein MHW47_06140 [Streptomyces sp. OfavH-34-F]|uniref:hypothetical protein n=1 Tax=Streptomyces sp. OfavH-34-F TaxID=2917760 RepID=UPI001EF220A4|nr:hypothetical protein [Streptomyces sp. OfavH-34-F]MCG7524022.1 hypothetical protein [Streptomyces sp. OfavH-34-F]
MSTPTSPQPGTPEERPAAAAWQLWILMVWHPAVGMAVDPVAVLALDTAPGADPAQYTVWVPLVYDEANPWRERLAEGVSPERIARWESEAGACQIAPAAVPEGAVDLRHAADLVLDELLGEVIPALPPRTGA